MRNREFDKIAIHEFNFLESDFGFRLVKCEKKDWGYELMYLSETTGVKIIYEFPEAYIFITLYQLIDGRLKENPDQIGEETTLHGYGLDDIITLRSPASLIKPAYQYGEKSEYYDRETGLTLYVSAFADNLKKCAADVLSGDFRIFSELNKIVKSRVKKYK